MARKFQHSYEVCNCKHVSLAEVIYSIKEKGAKNIEDIGKFTDAGTCCKCCTKPENDFGTEKMELYLSEILNKFIKS